MMTISRLDRSVRLFNWMAVAAIAVNLWLVFFFAPTERSMGNVQRILYFHVGSAWVGSIAFFVALVCGFWYLWKPSRTVDTVALASVEIGFVFLTMATVAGSVWGKPAWNTWWTWTPRLTLITIAWLTYAAYFMLRGAIEDDDKRGRFSAVYVIIAFVTIIMSYLSIRILRDIHPVVVGEAAEAAAAEGTSQFDSGMEARMGMTLGITTIVFTFLYTAWLLNRIRLQMMIDEVVQLKMKVAARLQG